MADKLKIRSHDELIAVIPHMLGFQPRESLVCVAAGDGPLARIDLLTPHEDMDRWLEGLTDVYLRADHPARVAIVAFGDDGRRTVAALCAVAEALAGGPEVGPLLWSRGDEWTDLLSVTRGTVSPSTRARLDAEFAWAGHAMPAASREELATAMQGDTAPLVPHLTPAIERWRSLDEPAREAEARWLSALVRSFLQDRTYLSDPDAARTLAAITDETVTDALLLGMRRDQARVHSELWQDLVRRSPAEAQDAAASLLAFSAWLEGSGAKAWVALDQVSQPNRIAELVASLLQQAVDPRTWDSAAGPTEGPRQAGTHDCDERRRGHARRPGPGDDEPRRTLSP